MNKECYVNANHYHKVSLKHLIRYPRQQRETIRVFSDDSVAEMKEMCGYLPGASSSFTSIPDVESVPTGRNVLHSAVVAQAAHLVIAEATQPQPPNGYFGSHSVNIGESARERGEQTALLPARVSNQQSHRLPAPSNYGAAAQSAHHGRYSDLPRWHNHQARGSGSETRRNDTWRKVWVPKGLTYCNIIWVIIFLSLMLGIFQWWRTPAG
jgi:hypothetical protein